MKRVDLTARPGWQGVVERQGLVFHSPAAMAPEPYWQESAAYQFSAREIDRLEAAANELQGMCLQAAQHVIDRQRYTELEIPPAAVPMIEWSWNQESPAVYGRFDIAWGGEHSGSAPKLLEYNADTPTSLLEAAVIQWSWLEEVGSGLPGVETISGKADQFNSIHERLIAKWRDVQSYLTEPVYFASLQPGAPDASTALDLSEDYLTTTYLQDTANQAGLKTQAIAMQDIGWNDPRHAFMDLEENQIFSMFKLYPWEAMVAEEFGPAALDTYPSMTWIEPIWKMLLSNKGILPILWELFPGHELLLEAHFEGGAPGSFAGAGYGMGSYVRKPIHGREGANIRMVRANAPTVETLGPYGGRGFIRQALAPETRFEDRAGLQRWPVLGLWMVDQECGGMGIRESRGPVTDNLSSFIPHYFV